MMPNDSPVIKPNIPEAVATGTEEQVISIQAEAKNTNGEVQTDGIAKLVHEDLPTAGATASPSQPLVISVNAAEETKASIDETPLDLDDTAELKGDKQYIGEVKKIIHDDADEPFLEEAKSENLQQRYLKDRFGVNSIVDKENK